ncbi:zinc-dependent metalloprotease [Pedobacter sp. WC2423]|uniref:zinc-dependent metalloprotease n=1 Tax=Pedobacter sp. WC2423 TaxID=3234142 RepID=UPI0034672065
MMKIFKKILLYLLLVLPSQYLHAQSAQAIPQISKYIKPGAKTFKGMFNIYVQDDKYLVEIPDQLLGREILTSVTIISGSAQRKRNPGMRFGFAGDAVNDRVIRFKKGINGKMNLVAPDFIQATDTSNKYYNSIKANLVPTLLAFDIIAVGNASSLIDITSLFAGDSDLFSLKGAAAELKLGEFEAAKSRILGVSSFENNVVFRSIKSYSEAAASPPAQVEAPRPDAPAKAEETNPTMWEVGASWFLLPQLPMQLRYADKRIGYFVTRLTSYDKNPEKIEDLAIANRWRMEPKAEDLQKFNNGELVEPAKPIVFYIDRNTPAYLIPYMIEGVNAWRKSFEKIGFKNAITGKLAPTLKEDPDYSMEDARYSYISYKPSEVANAYGPQVVDPRSGEILTSHVAVFHNILELLQRWYFSMCAATDPGARKIPMSKDLMGALVKNVITHEVGHTLGLRHNFAGSSSYPVDSIRNRDFIRKNSFGPSVMDYMRFNYAAQPEDKMTPVDLLPVIGVYDNYAIEWGYKYMPEKDPKTTAEYLTKWVSEKRKDPKFFYLEESDAFDPRVQSEDIGDNNMKANALGVENLKRTMANLNQWGDGPDQDYSTLRSMYRAVEGRYFQYLQHVVKNIGGVNSDNALRTENKSNYNPVSDTQQKEAVAYLKKYMLTEPEWLYPANIGAKTKFNFNTDVEDTYSDLLGRLMAKYNQLATIENITGKSDYAPGEFLAELQQFIFRDIENGKPISRYNRMLQRAYLNKILLHVDNPSNFGNNIGLIMNKQMLLIQQQAKAGAAKQSDFITKSHLVSIANMIAVWHSGKNDAYLTK